MREDFGNGYEYQSLKQIVSLFLCRKSTQDEHGPDLPSVVGGPQGEEEEGPHRPARGHLREQSYHVTSVRKKVFDYAIVL